MAGTITTPLPYFSVKAATIRRFADDPELHATAYFVPMQTAKSRSYCAVISPIVKRPEAITRSTAWRSAMPKVDSASGSIHHFLNHGLKRPFARPAQCLGFRRITLQMLDFGRPVKRPVGHDVISPMQPDTPESSIEQVLHAARFAGRQYIVIWTRLLHHQPHAANVILGVAPVAAHLQISQFQGLPHSRLDLGCGGADFLSHEISAAPW